VRDVLPTVLQRLEIEPPVLYWRELRAYGADLELLLRLGVLRETTPAGSACCPECLFGPQHRVQYIADSTTHARHGYIHCPQCGIVEVALDSLRRWRIDPAGFLRAAFSDAGVSGPATEVMPGRLWLVGKVTWAARRREVYFARCYRRDDGSSLVTEMSRRPRAVLFTPTEAAARRWAGAVENLVIALESALSLEDGSIRFDGEYVEGRLADAGLTGAAKAERPKRKRAERAAKIEVLEKELIAHLRAARDYAYATMDRTGTPALLPRPSQKQLAERTGLTEADVSRCLKDSNARELRLYWETAQDLDQIMRWKAPAGSRARS
jgi:hypothetical protein